MAEAIVMPKLGLTMKTGMVAQWNVREGERVAVGSPVVEITTEKITYVLEAQSEGVLLKILVPEEGEVPIGATIGVLGEPGEDITAFLAGASAALGTSVASVAPTPATAAARAGAAPRVAVSPAARKLAAELGIDVTTLAGTGPGGRVTIDDVNRATEAAPGAAEPAPAAAPTAATASSAAPPELAAPAFPNAAAGAPAAGAPGGVSPASGPAARPREELPYTGMRRAIGGHMATSWTVSPMVTHHVRADVHELLALLATINVGRAERDKVSITAAVVKAVAASLKERPRLNATLEGDSILLWTDINVGVAVALEEGLIVPVVKNADTKGIAQVSREIRSLARRARKNRLLPDEVSGGTFTVTSVGSYRSVDWFTPIINQPEAAILGVGRIIDDVVAVDGAPAVRSTMGLSLTFDHRIVDGAPAAEFLAVLLDYLAHPVRMLV